MNGKQLLKATGVLSLTIMLTVLTLDSVDKEIVVVIVMGVLAIVAPDVLQEFEWGPF